MELPRDPPQIMKPGSYSRPGPNAAEPQPKETDAKMAFITQTGRCVGRLAWGECHERSMVVSNQIRQPYRLHVALLRPCPLQRPSGLGVSPRTRTFRRLCSEGSPQRLHQNYGAPVL